MYLCTIISINIFSLTPRTFFQSGAGEGGLPINPGKKNAPLGAQTTLTPFHSGNFSNTFSGALTFRSTNAIFPESSTPITPSVTMSRLVMVWEWMNVP